MATSRYLTQSLIFYHPNYKLFAKLDLCWSYNSIYIKKKNEWKVVFMTSERLFKPIVIFFILTNSPATFQMMINEILQDLINTRGVISFINDVIVGTKKKKEYNKVVEEVVKRLVENGLYVKLGKCK